LQLGIGLGVLRSRFNVLTLVGNTRMNLFPVAILDTDALEPLTVSEGESHIVAEGRNARLVDRTRERGLHGQEGARVGTPEVRA
jgi:hypothetical protein